MSSLKVFTPGIGLIASKSIPILIELCGVNFSTTCSQPPGAAQRSTTALALVKN
jgi:hypothetical protein